MSKDATTSDAPLATMREALGDLHARIDEDRRARIAGWELPEERRVVRADELSDRSDRRVAVGGVFGSGSSLVVRALVARGRRVLHLVPDAELAARAIGDARFFLPGKVVLGFASNDTSPWADVNPDRRGAQLRLATLTQLASGAPFDVLVAPLSALARKVVARDVVAAHRVELAVDQDLDRDELAHRLVEAGYARAPLVEDPGSFAVRGSLLDVWSPASPRPVRIELLGDAILAMKEFDPEAQRTLAEVRTVTLCLARETPLDPDRVAEARERVRALCDAVDYPSAKTRALVDDVASGRMFFGADGFQPAFGDLAPLTSFLPDDLDVVLEDPSAAIEQTIAELDAMEADHDHRAGSPRFGFDAFFLPSDEVARELERFRTFELHRGVTVGTATTAQGGLAARAAAPIDTPTLHTFDQGDLERSFQTARQARGRSAGLEPLLDRLHLWHAAGIRVAVVARAQTQAERLATLLSHRKVSMDIALDGLPEGWFDPARSTPAMMVTTGSLARGIVAPTERLALVTDEEIFGTRSARRARRQGGAMPSASKAKAFLEDLKHLAVGDYVVHSEHGVGRYLGLVHREIGAAKVDLIAVEYAGADKLYLPVWRLNQLQKFAGGEGSPKLDRLGGQTFAKTKARAAREVRQMADELLRLYAERRAVERPPLTPVDDDYRAFEATFPFEETPDQARAIAEVERDLEATTPMDRLVCGDVGFGKTEVAIRAAFRVAASGRQVALLCPTTVLAQQHYLNVLARMRDHALNVRALSRFQSKAEQDDVVRGLKAGTVDIVVGTHRLLSKDIHFKRLGLLVVDEEQRFGVTHKERIKQLRSAVDVLTLSATPIPRTLQMAVTGLRDMSLITTPPVDRRAIRTIVTRNDPAVLTDAVTRELERGGQVFYVYNRIEGLYERAARIAELVPSARIAVAHGQLSEAALERAMVDFVEGRFDVLCATAIIESGLDIPRANTIVIDRADMFGLAQLYQLRGRVGRSRERAYCYLVVPPANELTDEARARLEALERHTELGSGFHVASLDLELRGAGDLLGAEQSGTVAAVGFELFCQMLDEAVHELRGETVARDIEPELSVDEETLLPDNYIDDVGVRLSLYKRLASADGEGEIDDIAAEMEDRFGPPPESARKLVRLMRLKVELRRLRALGCEATRRTVTLHLSDDTPLDPQKLLGLVQTKRSGYRITPDMRVVRRFGDDEPMKGGLDAADRVLGELAKCLRA
jgi:transcription-repair coupling factor (superfamily II helicase)